MSPSPAPDDPYTLTAGVDTNSFASQFATLSDMDSYSTPSLSPEQSSFLASYSENKLSRASSTGSEIPSTLTTSTIPAQTTSPTDVLASSIVDSSSTITSPIQSSPTQTNIDSSSNTAATVASASASSAANNATNNLSKQASDMSSPGMQAAVAVPIVVVLLVVAAFLFLCTRRRRRNKVQSHEEAEKTPAVTTPKKRWTRHLRVFSFDTELLMGGRYSSTNSVRSRQTGSLRSGSRSQHSETPSVHSVDEVAPPYRDAVSSIQPPNIAAVIGGGAVAAHGLNRSSSTATAPPPYATPAGRAVTPRSIPPATTQNPFSDGLSPISPVEGSPFNDPPGTTPPISRNSSLYRSDRDDASSIGDAASIRQATLARNASVMSGGRVIDDIRRGS